MSMEEAGDSHFKRERPPAYGHPPPLHMQPADGSHLHSYPHHNPQGAQMPQTWNPAPSPYHDGPEQRPPPPDGPPPHQPPPGYPPQHSYHPAPPPSQTPSYPPDSNYSRQNSVSGPIRSPPSGQQPHYSTPINGAPPSEGYYPPGDYRNRPSYPPPESPANAPQQPALNVQTTNHEMMPGPTQHAPPPGAYGPPPPHSAGPPPTPNYWAPPPYGEWHQQRRKPVRAAQACDSCRQRKAKCDEGRPECTHCKENALRCTYRDVPPQKSEKQMMQMGEKVDALGDKLDNIERHGEITEDKLNSLINTVEKLTNTVQSIVQSQPQALQPANMIRTRSRPQTKEEPRSSLPLQYNGSKNIEINAPFMGGWDKSAAQHVTEPPKKRGPMAASDLLMWTAVRELVPNDIPVTYVLDGEADRGLLRLYGCGEGEDKGDGHDGVQSPSGSSSSGRMDDDGSTASPSGVWGTGQLLQREGSLYPVYEHPGGVTPGGELLLDTRAVDDNVKSYMERMHILHPFLDTRVLRKMVHHFKNKHSWDYGKFHLRTAQSMGAGSKRKREASESPNSMTEELRGIPHHNGARNPTRNNVPIEHSVSNAIILLVIALGKICGPSTKPLTGPPKSSSLASGAHSRSQQQPVLGYGDLPPMPPPSSAPASPFTPAQTNGLPTASSASGLQGKNMDVIPGLAYFAKAADILGELPGGIDVSHVQANLLAGLYMGQLARVIPSHFYIANACRACQILIKSPDYIDKTMKAERRNLINFAFWSCLQLESDILAEVEIPASGIINREGEMLLEVPTGLTIDDPDTDAANDVVREDYLRHYSNQIQLRRTLNDAVNNIYSGEHDARKPPRLIETISENLESWRRLLRDWDWNDDEHESSSINHARMRGKYYGAKYIINRPALDYALNAAYEGTPLSRPSDSPMAAGSNSDHTSPAMTHHANPASSRRSHEMRPPARAGDQVEDWVLDACRRCVAAAIKSTTSFDRVPIRLVITNILGTAHAQFGNVIVLAATFNSPNAQLRSLVPESDLRYLIQRTIKFLEDKAPISPALGTDAKILRHVENKLFPRSSVPAQHPISANSSFSSAK